MYSRNMQYLQITYRFYQKTFNYHFSKELLGGFFRGIFVLLRNIYAVWQVGQIGQCDNRLHVQVQLRIRIRSKFRARELVLLVMMTLCTSLPVLLLPVVIIFCDTSFKISAIVIYSIILYRDSNLTTTNVSPLVSQSVNKL